jgi:hypothetical protein
LGFILLLAGLQTILVSFSEAELLRQTTLQSTRCQRIAKIAQVLGGTPEISMRAQYISELQNTLPIWEQQQARALKYKSSDLYLLATQAQPDFVAIDAAAKTILVHPANRADPVQVDIVLQKERNYTVQMSQLASLLQQHIEESNTRLMVIAEIIVGLILIAVVAQLVSSERERGAALKSIDALQTAVAELLEEKKKWLQPTFEQPEGGNHDNTDAE